MKYYCVTSVEGITSYGGWSDPNEYGCDVVWVKAKNKRQAKGRALTKMRTYIRNAIVTMETADYNPFQLIDEVTECSWAEYYQCRWQIS